MPAPPTHLGYVGEGVISQSLLIQNARPQSGVSYLSEFPFPQNPNYFWLLGNDSAAQLWAALSKGSLYLCFSSFYLEIPV